MSPSVVEKLVGDLIEDGTHFRLTVTEIPNRICQISEAYFRLLRMCRTGGISPEIAVVIASIVPEIQNATSRMADDVGLEIERILPELYNDSLLILRELVSDGP